MSTHQGHGRLGGHIFTQGVRQNFTKTTRKRVKTQIWRPENTKHELQRTAWV